MTGSAPLGLEPAIFDVVIFSRDRAGQLDLLLRSVKRFLSGYEPADVAVLYGFSTRAEDRAYNVVRAEHREFRYVCEADHSTGWRELALELVGGDRDVVVLTDEVALAAPLVAADAAQPAGVLGDRLSALDVDAPHACGELLARLAPELVDRAEIAPGVERTESVTEDFLAGRRLSLDALIAGDQTTSPLAWEERAEEEAAAAPRVSVVVPCFDCGEFLADTVGSVLAQTLRDFEVIIVDDGSQDESVAVAQRLMAEHPDTRIRLLRQRNSGHPSYPRNTGVLHARGEYVLCLDGDDMLTPSFLEKCVAALDANPDVSIAYTDQRHFGAAPRHVEVHEWDFGRLIHHNMLGIASVFRRAAWVDTGGFDAHMRYEDWDFWIACGAHGHHGIRVADTEWLYRTRSDGRYTTGGARQDRRTKAILVSKRPELYTAAQRGWATAVLAQDPAADEVDDQLGEIPTLDAFPPAPAAAERGSALHAASPALAAARAVARATGAMLLPVDATVPADPDGAILLVDRTPCEETLGALAAALPRATALVLWAPGWDEPTAVECLGRHGFEHGTVQIVDDPELGALAVLTATEAAAKSIAFPPVPERPFRALAVLPAFNEADVIFHAIGALVSEGVDVYLIDHNSTDGTAAAARPWLGRGLVRIERFPDDAGYPERNRHEMVWRDILRRVQDVSGEVAADWYMFVNADEFREAPWPGVTLGDALREIDELGYSAVNFELFDFRPVDDSFRPGEDPRRHLRHYDRPGRHDVLQIKAWKRQPQPVDLVTHGGHDLLFDGKRVFPVPFILRHYPIRSSEHGARKVLGERLPRFASEERADGWHVQYDGYVDRAGFLHDPMTLTEWDPVRVRAELLGSRMRELLLALCLSGIDPTRGEVRVDQVQAWLERRVDARTDEAGLRAAQERLTAAVSGVELIPAQDLDAVARHLSLALEAHARLGGNPLAAASMVDARDRLPRAA